MSHSCFIHPPTDGHLGCFHVLAIVNKAAVNIGVLMFFQISVLGSFRYIPRLEFYLAIKKKNILPICNNMDRPGEHYAKWNKPGRER